jgi:arginine decarboxylase
VKIQRPLAGSKYEAILQRQSRFLYRAIRIPPRIMTDWNIDKARRLYNVAHWSADYFDINAEGHLIARPLRHDPQGTIDLYELTQELQKQGLTLPVLVRFSDILHDRVRELNEAFAGAMAGNDYRGQFTAVYPIKVNQQRSVVAEILKGGGDHVGLEAGSKPELMAVLAHSRAGAVVVCNGYKDREYVRLALIGRQLGQQVYIVVEKLSELEVVIQESRALGIEPLIGMRVRLASIGAGNWQNTGGEKSKFGLSGTQLLRAVERLRATGMLDALQMMHFHMGSQIPHIGHIQTGVREAARFYAELHKLGVAIKCFNVGGGLGVDYEGSRSRSACSANYSIAEYANNIVQPLRELCDELRLPHPDIVAESGRAMTAHHAVLVTNVIDVEVAQGAGPLPPPAAGAPQIVVDMWDGFQGMAERSPIEAYHDAAYRLSEAQGMFNHGLLNLAQRAHAEQIAYATFAALREHLQPGLKAHREIIDELNEKLADKYFCNFSLFQSVPDVWAIGQIFPVMPLHRLGQAPTRRGVLRDITCDSDGRIDLYVDGEGVRASLALHDVWADEAYLLGIFLVGAYQEILGDMHNLFGDTDSVHVELDGSGGHQVLQPLRGDTVSSVLRHVHFNPAELLDAYRAKIAQATWLNAEQQQSCLAELRAGLEGYTYLED